MGVKKAKPKRARSYLLNLTEAELEFVRRTASVLHDKAETPWAIKPLISGVINKCLKAQS